MRYIHISIVVRNIVTRGDNKIMGTLPPHISSSEEIPPASLVALLPNPEQINHPFSNHIYTSITTMPTFNTHSHITHDLFNCTHIRTTLSSLDLWTDPARVTTLLGRWTEKLAGGSQVG